jgi:hypothetical protein
MTMRSTLVRRSIGQYTPPGTAATRQPSALQTLLRLRGDPGGSLDRLGRLDGIRLVVDPSELLQGPSLSFDTQKVPQTSFDDVPRGEEPDVVVSNVLQGDGSAELVEETHRTADDRSETKSLGSHGRLEGLDGDDCLQRRVGEHEGEAEEEVGGKSGLSERSADVVTSFVDLALESGIDAEPSSADYTRQRLSLFPLNLSTHPKYRRPKAIVEAFGRRNKHR